MALMAILRGFSLSVKYKKLLYDAVSGETSYATTGKIGGAGSQGGDAGFILQGLSEYLDGLHPGLPTRERVGV